MSRKTPQEQLSQVKLEIANLTRENSQLRCLSFVAMTLSKTALKTLKGELELIVKIIEGKVLILAIKILKASFFGTVD